MATAWLALAGAVWGLHLGRRLRGLPVTKATRAVLARRGPHALVVAVGGEVALGLAVALVAVVLTHTTGGAAPGVAGWPHGRGAASSTQCSAWQMTRGSVADALREFRGQVVVLVDDTLVADHDRPYNVTVAVLPAEAPSATAS